MIISDIIILFYGTKPNAKQFNAFTQHIKHYKLKSKELDHCKKGLEGEICYHQVKEELEKLSFTTSVVLLNCDYNLINGVEASIIHSMKKLDVDLIASQNFQKFGVNIIGSQLSIMDIIKPLIMDENKEILEPYLDFTDEMFSNVDIWESNQMVSKLEN